MRFLIPSATGLVFLALGAAPALADKYPVAVFSGLDKTTARVTRFDAKVDKPAQFGSLEVLVRACDKKPPEEPPRTAAYVEIDATYLVPEGSPLQTIEDVDAEGVRIAVSGRSAYDLYLTRSLKHAELLRAQGLPGALELFLNDKLDALAGLRPALNNDIEKVPGGRILEGQFAAVQHALHDVPAKQYVPCPQQLGPPAKAGERVRCCWPHRVPSTPLPYHHDAGFWHVLHEVPSRQY